MEIGARLAQVGASFCPLRWTYMQVDLVHGRIKACCKTPFVQADADEIRNAGSQAIFNGASFQARRRDMLEGRGHADCDPCREQERRGLLSYRLSESAKEPHASAIGAIERARRVDGVVPRHIEFILSTACDLTCTYCGPEYSSSWAADLRRNGVFAMMVDQGGTPSPPPGFQDAFWTWFDGALPQVHYIQFNGGEPLVQPELYRTLERIARSSAPVGLGVITNLNTPAAHFAKFCRVLPELLDRYSFRLGISQDSIGARAEYIRSGLSWNRFDANLRGLLGAFPALEVQIAPTMSALNVTSILHLLRYLDELSQEFGPRILLRPSVVMSPEYLAPWALPPEYARCLADAVSYLGEIGRWPNMSERLSEIMRAMTRGSAAEPASARFIEWARINDERRGCRITSTFPELAPLFG